MAAIDLDTHTLAAALWTPTRLSPLARATVLAIAGSLFVALCAQITVPFWPVPLTGQTFAVLSVGLVCGWRIGGAALLVSEFLAVPESEGMYLPGPELNFGSNVNGATGRSGDDLSAARRAGSSSTRAA